MVYLATYPDVMKAVENGVFKNGFEHWDKHGRGSRNYWCMYQEFKYQQKDPFQVENKYIK